MIDAKRAESAYTDVLAVEYDGETDLVEVVTLGGSYTVDLRESSHQCPDREYNGVALCKHIVAALVTDGRLDVPDAWLTVEDFDDRNPGFQRHEPADFGGGETTGVVDL